MRRVFRTDGAWGFYPVVDRADTVRELLDLGVKTVQLRIKHPDLAVRRQALARAIEAGESYGAQVVVNDFADLALELGARWLHLGQQDLDHTEISGLRAAGIGLGVSTHSPGELLRALDLNADYVALGPVYETTLKRMRFAPQGLARVAHWKALANRPLVGIGGITLERAPSVLAAGADSVALVSDILRADRVARVRAWLSLFSSRT